MASIRKRGNTYQITVSNGRRSDGSQIIETSTFTPELGMTKRQEQKALESFVVHFEEDVKAGKNMSGNKLNLKKLSELFLEDMKDELGRNVYAAYKSTLESRIIPRIGHYKIADISQKILKDYANILRQDGARRDGKAGGLSEGTISKDLSIISSMLSYAAGEGYIPLNPIIYSGKQKNRQKIHREYHTGYFTIEQTKWFLWALDNPIRIKRAAHERVDDTGKPYHVAEYSERWMLPLKWKIYFYIALFTGNRRGENISLTWQDLNFETGEIQITKSTAYAPGEMYLKDTKTHSSRTCVVPKMVMEAANQLKKEEMQVSIEIGSKWEGHRGKDFEKNFVFTQWNGKQMHISSPYHQFKRIIKIFNQNVAENDTQKISDKASMHDLRHTAASILIANNMDPRSVAGILGHADPTTTLNIYSYFFKTKNEEAANIMQNILLK